MDRLSDFIGQLRCLFRGRQCIRVRVGSESDRVQRLGQPVRLIALAGLSASLLMAGCSAAGKKTAKDLQYLDGDKPVSYYKEHATEIEYPAIDTVTAKAVQLSGEPRNLHRSVDDEVREISLHECILTALTNNEIVETTALGGVGTKVVLTNPTGTVSVYDSAIQETNILFGRRGVEAALSDFDTTFASGMVWGRNAGRLNVPGAPSSTAETGTFTSSLSKAFATGASAQVYNNWNYLGTNAAGTLFPSSYTGGVGATFRQPLLAGSGTTYTRTAGPQNPAFGAITGVSQGVLIARINQDITLADFESAVQVGLRDIENTYWDLYLFYRLYDTAVATHASALSTWDVQNDKREVGTGRPEDELQARDRVYETKALYELALNEVYKTEVELRRLIGLPMNDGTVLRPSDSPTFAELKPDWQASLVDGLTYRVELRRQKWQIKSLQLQLDAARTLVRPRLDAVANYNVNGFGDRLLGQGVTDPSTGLPIGNAFGSMTNDDLNSWTMGVQFSMPLGLRQARSQARNYELQVAKANAVLAAQERSVANDIAVAIQDVAANYSAATSSENRFRAAASRVRIVADAVQEGRKDATIDLLLRAQESSAQAEASYFRQIVAYNKAIVNLNLATGRILDYNNVYLAEGRWNAEAYNDATMRAVERTHAHNNPALQNNPGAFASKAPVDPVELMTPILDGPPKSNSGDLVPENLYEGDASQTADPE
jgi:outer membrane protein TolC